MKDEFTAKARDEEYARYSRALSGLETGDGNSHHLLKEASVANAPARKGKEDKDSSVNRILFRDLLDRQLAELQKLIDQSEHNFAAKDGEAWREKLALAILDPDLIPQRRDGESMTAYRARLEVALRDEFLNEDGSIKDEYKNHPEYGEYAQWAQWKHDQEQATTLKTGINDPSLSDADRAAIVGRFTQSASYGRLEHALNHDMDNSTHQNTLDAAKEGIKDMALSGAANTTEGAFIP